MILGPFMNIVEYIASAETRSFCCTCLSFTSFSFAQNWNAVETALMYNQSTGRLFRQVEIFLQFYTSNITAHPCTLYTACEMRGQTPKDLRDPCKVVTYRGPWVGPIKPSHCLYEHDRQQFIFNEN